MRGLYWFRNDLRVEDNAALFKASQLCRDGLLAVYFIPQDTWRKHHKAPVQVDFILRHLPSLKAALQALNIPLQVIIVKNFEACAHQVVELARQHQIEAIYGNRDYEYDERKRDKLTETLLYEHHIDFHLMDDNVVVAPDKVLTGKGTPYTVFTPFKKSAMIYLSREGALHCAGTPEKQTEKFAESSDLPQHIPGFDSVIPSELWPAGIDIATQRLDDFVQHRLFQYDKMRDYPHIDGTSKLSPYLHIGAISVKRCFERAITAGHVKQCEGINAWISELLWRDFYKQISFHYPHVCKGKSFHAEYDDMTWDHDEKAIAAWKAGETGYPLVDAAMKQLVKTGWMHNRLRMLVAMFFCKLMYQDWRIGEQFFMEHLIDGDFSSNNGGWQWSSATGTDAAPYFRIFNPRRQSEHFDPEGVFIREFLPALKDFSVRDIHAPSESVAKAAGYALPILDYDRARKMSLDRFLAFKGRSRRGRRC